MSFWKRLFGDEPGFPTFDQELEILVARWTDRSRKKDEALSVEEICTRLLTKVDQLNYREKTQHPRKKK